MVGLFARHAGGIDVGKTLAAADRSRPTNVLYIVFPCREGAGKACAAALERSAPLSVSAAAAAPPADGSSAGASGRGKPADGYSKLRGVLSRFDAKMRGSRRTAARGGGEGGGYTWQLPPGKAVAGEQAGVAIRERPQRAMLTRDPRPNVMSLTVSAAVRQARLDQSVSLNKNICRRFDDLDRQLSRGGLGNTGLLRWCAGLRVLCCAGTLPAVLNTHSRAASRRHFFKHRHAHTHTPLFLWLVWC